MANEITVQTSLRVANGNLTYNSQPTNFRAAMTGGVGPTPGAISIGIRHTEPDLSQLTALGGMCRLMNLDTTNFVEWGLYDSVAGVFFPLGELLPGESYVIRLSRYLGEEMTPGTGTGTAHGGHTVSLSLKADVAPCIVLVECFDK